MTEGKPTRRVRLIYCDDAYSSNPAGLEGTVVLVDNTGTLHVHWDNGSILGLIPDKDRWEEITSTDNACPSCDARSGERCSDSGVFVRDMAFRRDGLP